MSQEGLARPSSQDLLQEIEEQSSQGEYIYRGEPECYQRISSTLYRQYEKVIETEDFDIEFAQEEMLEQVKRYTSFTDDTDILTELQHFGGNTNLIDFSGDYLIALFFACDGSFDKDDRLILFDKASRPHQITLPRKNQNHRVISQKSIFVRSPTGCIGESEVRIVSVPKELKQEAMEHLEKYHGISTGSIYNDLLGYIRNQEKHQTAYAEFYIAYTSFNKEEFREAIRHYDSAIRLNPFMTAYTNRGAAKFRLNCFKAAISDCNVAIGYDSSDAIAYYYRGIARKSLEDRNGAVEDLGRAKVLAQEQRQEDVLLAINEELSDFNHSGSKKQ